MNLNQNRLFQKDFTLVVIGQIISLFGNAILRFALPLYLLRETGSAALFGAVTACSFIPMIALSMLGGILADRVNKRNIMVLLDFSTAAIITIFYLLLGKVPIIPLFILVLMLLYGISGIYQPAVQASIPLLVPSRKLMSGNAVINQVGTLSNLLGPVMGGMIFGLWGITPILLLSTICFVLSAVMEIFIKIPHQRQEISKSIFRIVKDDLSVSYQFVKQEKPVFFSIAVIIAAFNLVLSAVMIVGIPILIIQVLGLTDAMLGFSQGALALGGLGGGILTPLISSKLRIQKSYLFLSVCAAAVFFIGLSILLHVPIFLSYGVILVMSFISMAASTLFTIQLFTMIQLQTPPHLIGKIMAAILTVAMCSQPIGQALYGLLFDLLEGYSWAVLIGASAAALIVSLCSKRIFNQAGGSAESSAGLSEINPYSQIDS